MIAFKNDSSSSIEPFSIIKLTGIEKQDNGLYWLTADQCDSAANFLLATTSYENVAAGKYGRCTPIGEIFTAKYDTGDGTPANEENWGPDNGTFKLKKNFGGGQYAVIGVDSTAEVAMVMEIGTVERWGKADANIAENGTGAVSVYSGTGAKSSWTDTGDNVTARNLDSSQADSGTYVKLQYKGSEWVLRPLEPASTVKLGKTDAAIAKGASGTVSVWSGTPGSETDTTTNITAYNAFADVAITKWVWCQNNGDGWYITAAEC